MPLLFPSQVPVLLCLCESLGRHSTVDLYNRCPSHPFLIQFAAQLRPYSLTWSALNPHRVGACANSLFFSLVSPFKAVTPNTISRWIRTIMLSAGVVTSVFGAHSTRGAAASRASVSGAHVDSILRLGHWVRASTFFRFYKRSVDTSAASAIFGEHNHPL